MNKKMVFLAALAMTCGPAAVAAEAATPKLDFDCQDQMRAIMVLSSGYSPSAIVTPGDYGNPERDVVISDLKVTRLFEDAAGFWEGRQSANVSSKTSSVKGRIVVDATRGGCIVKSVRIK